MVAFNLQIFLLIVSTPRQIALEIFSKANGIASAGQIQSGWWFFKPVNVGSLLSSATEIVLAATAV